MAAKKWREQLAEMPKKRTDTDAKWLNGWLNRYPLQPTTPDSRRLAKIVKRLNGGVKL